MVENPAVAAAAVTGAAAVIVSIIQNLRLQSSVKEVKRQVQNDHTENLRDDLDRKHSENARSLRTIGSAVLSVQSDVSWLMRQQAKDHERLGDLEQTLNPKEKKK